MRVVLAKSAFTNLVTSQPVKSCSLWLYVIHGNLQGSMKKVSVYLKHFKELKVKNNLE